MRYIDIDKWLVPYRFNIQISDVTYTFEIHYNVEFDYFTIDLYKDDEVLVIGEKLVYGKSLFRGIRNEKFPIAVIIPLDLSNQETKITFNNIGNHVFLYLLTREDFENGTV